jgi:hypothetical protein
MTPRSFVTWILNRDKVHLLRYVPGPITLMMEVTLALYKRNVRVIAYMKYYLRNIRLFLKRKWNPGKVPL